MKWASQQNSDQNTRNEVVRSHHIIFPMPRALPDSFGNYAVESVFRTCTGAHRLSSTRMPYATWLPRLFMSDEEYAAYWAQRTVCLKGMLKRFGIRVHPTEGVVLHFRCGDVPFDSHRVYRMPSPAFLRFVNQHLRARKIQNASLYWTLSHSANTNNARQCEEMVSTIIRQLTSVAVRWVDEPDPRKALQAFGATRTLVSLVPSSFSFVVGVVAGDYISPFLGLSGVEGRRTLDVENKTRARSLARRVHWTMSTLESLAPGEVVQ